MSEETTEVLESSAEVETEATTGTKKAPKTIARLEEEGDIAADYLEGLLDIADLDGDIDIDVENDRASPTPSGAQTTHTTVISTAPRAFNSAIVYAIDPPVASIGSSTMTG
jgi:spoIIIJ-associated protein